MSRAQLQQNYAALWSLYLMTFAVGATSGLPPLERGLAGLHRRITRSRR